MTDTKLIKYQERFAWSFIISSGLVVLILVGGIAYFAFISITTAKNNDLFTPTAGETIGIVPVLAIATSISSLIGFVITTLLSIRKETRDKEKYRLELEKTKLEIENLKIQLSNKSNLNS